MAVWGVWFQGEHALCPEPSLWSAGPKVVWDEFSRCRLMSRRLAACFAPERCSVLYSTRVFSSFRTKLKNNGRRCSWEWSSSSTSFPIALSPGQSLCSVRLDKSSIGWLFPSMLLFEMCTACRGRYRLWMWVSWATPAFVTGYSIDPFYESRWKVGSES